MNPVFKEMNKLKDKHKEIHEKIKGKKIAYIDIPMHYNTGDLLIYLGTEAFFSDYHCDIKYRGLQHSINHKIISQCDIILVHGGGNFGDIYINEHRNREKLLLKHKEKEIIFLPQSIHFNSNDELNKTIDFFNNFSNVTIYTRDHESYLIAQKICENVIMMPDMAHSLHPLIEESELTNINKTQKKILNLMRRDNEAVINRREINKLSFDWSDLCKPSDIFTLRLVRLMNKCHYFDKKKLAMWSSQVNFNVKLAINTLNNYDVVYTDRLHGFILAYLLGKQTVLFDNSYGKIEKYVTHWISASELIKKNNE
ncbi:polysaccharide pyruvyl transferase [Proteus vulgaris]|uniref:polysaccharide pyruvyl transferase family protein n=1 Tax=Proteus mirabilis TaxID=584 RepID=UPI001373DB34|nr:polysaccharide pyruvyl transferase family protein [Proteus mirabilis]MDC5973694.1 polysaccharide pyruvyl transferase family protein [Proteus mirabilis]QHP75099.1 polysaccharide pyruvyl transferase [Proteus vulgaris]